jgi:endonuclease-3 related protein
MKIIDVYQKLLDEFGKQHWWPTTSDNPKFEIVIGAILTQNTNWNSVEKAVANLNKKKLLHPVRLAKADIKTVQEAVRPSGFYKQKSERIVNIAKYIIENFGGDVDKFLKKITREELLAIKGIGRETADSILLYAGSRLFFPIDAYTIRFCKRFGLIDGDYDELQKFFHSELPKDLTVYNELHALIVKLCKEYCRKEMICTGCPLNDSCVYYKK